VREGLQPADRTVDSPLVEGSWGSECWDSCLLGIMHDQVPSGLPSFGTHAPNLAQGLARTKSQSGAVGLCLLKSTVHPGNHLQRESKEVRTAGITNQQATH
jgi:hypothetical protein